MLHCHSQAKGNSFVGFFKNYIINLNFPTVQRNRDDLILFFRHNKQKFVDKSSNAQVMLAHLLQAFSMPNGCPDFAPDGEQVIYHRICQEEICTLYFVPRVPLLSCKILTMSNEPRDL